MKKFIVVFTCLLIVAVAAIAAEVTQTASAVNKNLPPSVRDTQINNAVSDLTKVDIPAIIAALNIVSSNGVGGLAVVYTTNVFACLDASTNAVSYTNINARYTVTLLP